MSRLLKFLAVAACVYPTAALPASLLHHRAGDVVVSDSMTTPVLASFNPPTSTSDTFFFSPVGASGGSLLTQTSTAVRVPIPIAGTIKGLSANINTAQNTATPASIIDNINGTNGTLTCSFTAATAPFSCNDPSFHSEGFHASRTKIERRARKFVHAATWTACGGRAPVCTQNSASQSFIWRHAAPHSLRRFHSNGGGETMLAFG
jgi:hypothetical protein